jgi:hypothetical protein
MQDLTAGGDDAGSAAVDAPVDSTADDAALDASAVNDSSPDAVAHRTDGGDACVSEAGWCSAHCGAVTDNCGKPVDCPAACDKNTCIDSCGRACCSTPPRDAGCSMGACDGGAQCCTGSCGSDGNCASTCGVANASCTLLGPNCCYGLSCKAALTPLIRTCQ